MTKKTRASGSTILLAEEDVLLRAPLAQYLRECGHRVVEATTAFEAKLALSKIDLNVSTVVTSVQLAGDGFGISTWVRRHRPDVNVKITGTLRRAVEVIVDLCGGGAPHLDPQLLLRRMQQMLATRKSPPSVA
ncbi:MAG: response regulator [Bradyrhizobium sp.]|uniref:response regulator n=1 Tax=Bradyrhizobium sp. TaxID=376 RepID=UPI001C287C4B|nr:response regulator [Bradyrhizobium sp.]MBU6464050.1 response regulator [Pseudomonadota bacterium]MDE2066411.1 response regulator [Bradyrhizobium sp.]MDE2243218.1 response regulator [Bradyrhizobium sp.]MDE2470155.1 response regulator [Bradyrhizobium sp.]